MDLYLYPRHFELLFRDFFGEAALFCPRQNVEFEQTFLLVLLNRHSECMCHCVDVGKVQNTIGGFKMTIENARALQEELAAEAVPALHWRKMAISRKRTGCFCKQISHHGCISAQGRSDGLGALGWGASGQDREVLQADGAGEAGRGADSGRYEFLPFRDRREAAAHPGLSYGGGQPLQGRVPAGGDELLHRGHRQHSQNRRLGRRF